MFLGSGPLFEALPPEPAPSPDHFNKNMVLAKLGLAKVGNARGREGSAPAQRDADNPTVGPSASLFVPGNSLWPSLFAPTSMVLDIVEGQKRGRLQIGQNGKNAKIHYGVKPDIFKYAEVLRRRFLGCWTPRRDVRQRDLWKVSLFFVRYQRKDNLRQKLFFLSSTCLLRCMSVSGTVGGCACRQKRHSLGMRRNDRSFVLEKSWPSAVVMHWPNVRPDVTVSG